MSSDERGVGVPASDSDERGLGAPASDSDERDVGVPACDSRGERTFRLSGDRFVRANTSFYKAGLRLVKRETILVSAARRPITTPPLLCTSSIAS
jgi:hypothetical protein